MATNIAYGSDQAVTLQSIALFTACMQRPTILNRLTGQLPKQANVDSKLRFQSGNEMPIVRCMDLTKKAGDEITFDLVNPLSGKPIMGEQTAEGLGAAMSFSQDSLRINQTRKPISAGGSMSQQRTPHELRKLARSLGQNYMDRLVDQQTIVHLAGARGFEDNIEWVVPLESDADFTSIMINSVKAPTRNRHFLSTSSSIEMVAATDGTNVDLATTDVMNIDVVDALRTKLDSMPLPPSGVKFPGDQMAADQPMRVLMVSSEQYTSLVQSTNFRTWQANAMARASMAKNNPLFMGEAGLWNGILIVKMPRVVRFYASDEYKWCASLTAETETTDIVSSTFSTTHAVDRALLLGGQALCEAYGKTRQTGNPFFWSEVELDHKDKLEVLIGMVSGKSKVRFDIDHGNTTQPTDNGVIALDTAVRLSGV